MNPHPYSYRSQTSYYSYSKGRIINGEWTNLKAYFIDDQNNRKTIIEFNKEDMQVYKINDDDLWCVDNLLEYATWEYNK